MEEYADLAKYAGPVGVVAIVFGYFLYKLAGNHIDHMVDAVDNLAEGFYELAKKIELLADRATRGE